MYDPPAYLRALIIAGTSAIAVATCVALYGGAIRADLGRSRAALPAGLGDIAVGIAAPLAARKLAQGTGRRAALWFNAFGITDLVVAGALGALTGYQMLNVTPSAAPISELPLALVPTVTVPLLLAVHITSIITLARAPRPAQSAAGPLIPGVTPT